jgi:hypothetical protein
MELKIVRTYYPEGTNGELYVNGALLCYTIELPWKANKRLVSCIPEGKYELKVRFSPRFGDHLQLLNVKERNGILFHPANDALKELKGCIAPAEQLTGRGRGTKSKAAFKKLLDMVYPALEKGEKVQVTISG